MRAGGWLKPLSLAGVVVALVPASGALHGATRTTPEATTRIYALNHIAAKPDDGGSAHGVRFTPQEDGSGLYCAPGAADLGRKLGALCQSWQPASNPPKALARKLDAACRDKPFYAAKTKRRAPPSDSPFRDFNPF